MQYKGPPMSCSVSLCCFEAVCAWMLTIQLWLPCLIGAKGLISAEDLSLEVSQAWAQPFLHCFLSPPQLNTTVTTLVRTPTTMAMLVHSGQGFLFFYCTIDAAEHTSMSPLEKRWLWEEELCSVKSFQHELKVSRKFKFSYDVGTVWLAAGGKVPFS